MRLSKLRRFLKKKGHLPYLITDLNNIKYLTGFRGSMAYMLVTGKKSYFITDSRYVEYSRSILDKSVQFVLLDIDLNKTIIPMIKDMGEKALFVEGHSIYLSSYLKMKKELRGIKIFPGDNEVGNIRIIKDDGEIKKLRHAAEITDGCFSHLLNFLKPGLSEWEISIEIENFYKKSGCKKTSFDSIVASGEGSSMPHYETSMNKKIKSGDIILLDMGCQFEDYNSDLTRTVFMNRIDPDIKKIYEIVLNAQEAALTKIRPGILSGRLDGIARDIITGSGYGEMFGHSLGHGLGIEIHEEPSIKVNGSVRLKRNMVITIEPGIYLPGIGGIRIEDMALVTSQGYEVLTKSDKKIIIL